jgi:DNA repair protein RadD
MVTLRDYQSKAVNDIRTAYVNGKRAPLFVLATGGGKTVVFSYIANTTAARGKRVLILVHRIELLRQTSAKLYELGTEHGIINPKFTPNHTAKVQIASVQTLAGRIKKGKARTDYDLVIVDEAHHAVASQWKTILSAMPEKCKMLGVTATPVRGDGTGLGDIFDSMILGPSIKHLTERGSLVPSVVYAPMEKIDLSAVKIKNGDYDPNDLESIIDNSMITGNAVDYYRRICANKPAIVFCCSIKHAEHVAEEFRAAGFRAQSIDGTMEDAQRRSLIAGLANGHVEVLTSCDIISEGTDIPAVTAAILLRPTQSTGLFLQQVGRALRPAPGKARAIILDHVGNILTHGLPDEEREWSLEGEEKKKRKKDDGAMIRVKQCPACFAMHAPAPKCPLCGHQYVTEERTVDQRDGELREIKDDDKLMIKRLRAKEIAKAKTYEDLVAIGAKLGYKPGWAKHKFDAKQKTRERFGGPPPPTEMPAYMK